MRFRFLLTVLSLALIAALWAAALWPFLSRPPASLELIGQYLFTVKVPILVYHSIRHIEPADPKDLKYFSVEPAVFARQLDYLKNNDYSVITLDDLVSCLKHKRQPPPRSVVITFDDGWANQYQNAFPQLKARRMTAVFFVYTNAIGRKNFMSWDELKDLAAAGMTIGSHTKSHPMLHKIADPARLHDEIAGSKAVLEKKLGQPVDFFAYPFGRFDAKVVAEVKQAGYRAARSVRFGDSQTPSDLFTLKIRFVKNSLSQFYKL